MEFKRNTLHATNTLTNKNKIAYYFYLMKRNGHLIFV